MSERNYAITAQLLTENCARGYIAEIAYRGQVADGGLVFSVGLRRAISPQGDRVQLWPLVRCIRQNRRPVTRGLASRHRARPTGFVS